MENYMHELLSFNDYHFVATPVVGATELYKISGH